MLKNSEGNNMRVNLMLSVTVVIIDPFSIVNNKQMAQKTITRNNSTTSTPEQSNEGNFLTYTNSTYGIKIQFPSDGYTNVVMQVMIQSKE